MPRILDERGEEMIAAARKIFLDRGYAATSMSAVARMVGGSKTTLWSYFRSKEALFAAMVEDSLDTTFEMLGGELSADEDLETALLRFGAKLRETLSEGELLKLSRLIVSEAERFPGLAELFYRRGPLRGQARLADWMLEKMRQGTVRTADPAIPAGQFVQLCLGARHQRALLGIGAAAAPLSDRTELEEAISTFCRAWKA